MKFIKNKMWEDAKEDTRQKMGGGGGGLEVGF